MKIADAPLKPLTTGPQHHFFGYFDKSPWRNDPQNPLLLAHETNVYDRMPQPGEAIAIGVVNGAGSFRKISESQAWNLQQGALPMWIPGDGVQMLHNDIREGKACAVRVDVTSGETQLLPRPVAALSPDGHSALSYNFGRLSRLKPEYGYVGLKDPYADQRIPEGDGIWQFDLKTGAEKLVVPFAAVLATGPDSDVPEAEHYLNHALYNRDGSRFCFLHRYISPSGAQHTRLLSCRADGSELTVLISGMASHFGWRNPDQLLCWAGERAMIRSTTAGMASKLPVMKILKKLYRALGKPAAFKAAVMKDRYILFDHTDGSRRDIVKGVLHTDGHCSFSPDGEWFVTDTYPDKHGNAGLYLCHIADEQVWQIGKFRFPPELDNEVRCDLHPRWHPFRPAICVDAVKDKVRQMYEIDISAQMDQTA